PASSAASRRTGSQRVAGAPGVGAVTPPLCSGSHGPCEVGPALSRTCGSCVNAVCALDPFCCDGGYLSYYSMEPTWDAKCVAEVKGACPEVGACASPTVAGGTQELKTVKMRLQAGVHYPISLFVPADL